MIGHVHNNLTISGPIVDTSTLDTSRNSKPAPIKTPLSPKRTHLRRRHSSAESEESFSMMSQVSSTPGDQSDLEIRVHALQEDLKRRMKTATKLKKEQKLAKRERLKVQEDALKKQIEVYDQLIEQTKADIVATSPPPAGGTIVQPQIKTPKQQSLRSESPTQSLSPTQQNSIEESSSTDTIIASPQKTPATPVCPDEPESQISAGPAAGPESNLNYSDDFTASSSVSSPQPQIPYKPKLSEKTVDAICGHLLEAMIEDTVGKMKKKSPAKPVSAVAVQQRQQTSSTSASASSPQPTKVKANLMQTAFDISSESSEEGNLEKYPR